MAHTYILETSKQGYYVGSTGNLEQRLNEYQRGKVQSTKFALPVKLVYEEHFSTIGEAKKKEYQIKRWKSRKLIELLIRKSTNSIYKPSSSSLV